VALLLFEKPGFIVTPFVLPICLWDEEYNFDVIAGSQGEVVGWGMTEDRELSDNLKVASLRVEPHLDCYLQDREYFSSRLKPGKNFCAGVNG